MKFIYLQTEEVEEGLNFRTHTGITKEFELSITKGIKGEGVGLIGTEEFPMKT